MFYLLRRRRSEKECTAFEQEIQKEALSCSWGVGIFFNLKSICIDENFTFKDRCETNSLSDSTDNIPVDMVLNSGTPDLEVDRIQFFHIYVE